MEMIAMLGGLSTGTEANPMESGLSTPQRLVSPPPVRSAGVTAQPDTVKLVSVFAVGTILGFILGRGTR